MEAIASLNAHAVAVQEITDPYVFAEAARLHLGKRWRFTYCDPCAIQRVGVLYDGSQLDLLSTAIHRETELYAGAKPAFAARFRAKRGGPVVHVMAIHLKAGGDHAAMRRRQLGALSDVVRQAMSTGERFVLLGDFNATSPADRAEIARLAETSHMHWATAAVPCTSYWNRRDGCIGTALDHILTWTAPRATAAKGPCETEGCDRRDRCPRFHHDVSDHCPVVTTLR